MLSGNHTVIFLHCLQQLELEREVENRKFKVCVKAEEPRETSKGFRMCFCEAEGSWWARVLSSSVPSSEVTYGLVAADLLHSLLAVGAEPCVLKIQSLFELDENSYPLQQDFFLLDFCPDSHKTWSLGLSLRLEEDTDSIPRKEWWNNLSSEYLFFICLWILPVYNYVPCMCLVLTEARRGCQIPWDQSRVVYGCECHMDSEKALLTAEPSNPMICVLK